MWRTMALTLACAALHTTSPAAEPVPLTTEAQLAEPATAAAIESFWTTVGRPGRFEGRRGVSIATMRFEQPPGRRDRGAIVLVNGRTESMLKYKEAVHDLYRAGWSVFALDHRGQGLSGREPEVAATPEKGHVHRFEDYVEDLRTFVAGTVLPAGHPRHFLWAHSMGGAITALFLQSGAPEVRRFDGAVLSSPMLRIRGIAQQPADWFSCRLAASRVAAGHATDWVLGGGPYADDPLQDSTLTGSAVRHARMLQAVAAAPQIRLGSPTWGWLDAACRASSQARNGSADVPVPTMVIVSGEDRIVHNDGAVTFCLGLRHAATAGGCGGPGDRPVVVPGAQHELFIERDPLRRAAMTRALDFMARQAGR